LAREPGPGAHGKFALAAAVTVVSMLGSMLLMAHDADTTLKQVDLLGRLGHAVAVRLQQALAGVAPRPAVESGSDSPSHAAGDDLVGRPVLRGAWSGFKHRTADMNTLIAWNGRGLPVFARRHVRPRRVRRRRTPGGRYYESCPSIIALILSGGCSRPAPRAVPRKRSAPAGLRPRAAHVVARQGDGYRGRGGVPGRSRDREARRKIPVDGIVTDGASAVNESVAPDHLVADLLGDGQGHPVRHRLHSPPRRHR